MPEGDAPPPPVDAPPPEPAPDEPPAPAPGGKGSPELVAALEQERKRAKKAEVELATLRKQALSDTERAVVDAKESGRAEAARTYQQRILRSELRAIAAPISVDADVVVAALNLEGFEVDADGNYDPKVLTAAVEGLIKTKPFLGKAPPGPGSAGNRMPQGPRGVSSPQGDGGSNPGLSEGDAWLRAVVRNS